MRAPFWGVVALVACSGDGGSDSDSSDASDDPSDADTDIDTDADSDLDTDTDTNDTDTTDTEVPGDPVTVTFSGKVQTLAGTPFGFDESVRMTEVTGSFTYDRTVPDGLPETNQRSEFDHAGGGGPFTLSVGGRTITGSDQPVVSIDLASGTFRWVDGPQLLDASPFRAAAVDGVTDEEIQIRLSVTPTIEGAVFSSDQLPPQFPFVPMDLNDQTAITFAVEDANGTVLMQLAQFRQDPVPPIE